MDRHLVDLIQFVGGTLTVLSLIVGASEVIPSDALKRALQVIAFGIVGAAVIGPLYFRLFASPLDMAHPFTSSTMWAGILFGITGGCAGGLAPVVSRSLIEGYESETTLEAEYKRSTEELRSRILSSRQQIEKSKQALAASREATDAHTAIVSGDVDVTSVTSQQSKIEETIIESEQALEKIESQMSESSAKRAREKSDRAIKGLPFTRLEYATHRARIVGAAFVFGIVSAFVLTHQALQSLFGGVSLGAAAYLQFTLTMKWYSRGPQWAAAHSLAPTDKARTPVFSRFGVVFGVVNAVIPSTMQILPNVRHPSNALVAAMLNLISGAVVGGTALSITNWVDNMTRRHFVWLALISGLIGVILLEVQPILDYFNVAIR